MTDELKSFKISEKSPAAQKARPQGEKADSTAPAASASAGFPLIEYQVEADGPALGGLADRRKALEELAKSGPAKERPRAKQAAIAYARTEAVLGHLLSTKAKMMGPKAE